jgi:tRNA A-37 threonylcarbamoyl transferase component Bud32
MCIKTDDTELELPPSATLLSSNGIAMVWRGNDGYIYKRSMPFLIENELYFLRLLEASGFTPAAIRYDKYTIRMDDLGISQPVTDKDAFAKALHQVICELHRYGIRHGDLTIQAIVIKDNRPYLIDFAESRFANDPRPDKRRGGDLYWAERLLDEL